MAFRSDEAALRGYDQTKNYLIPRTFSPAQRIDAERALQDIVTKCGPPIDGYPTWHPLVPQRDGRFPETYPNERCGYRGLDHTRHFAHGFVTCPYGDGQEVIDSAESLPCPPGAVISAERLEAKFYAEGATAILVGCEWTDGLEENYTIPKSIAVPLMLEQELPAWRWAERAESWDTMRPYLLGTPHGRRSSLFVTQETSLAIKRVYEAMVESGMFGPMKF